MKGADHRLCIAAARRNAHFRVARRRQQIAFQLGAHDCLPQRWVGALPLLQRGCSGPCPCDGRAFEALGGRARQPRARVSALLTSRARRAGNVASVDGLFSDAEEVDAGMVIERVPAGFRAPPQKLARDGRKGFGRLPFGRMSARRRARRGFQSHNGALGCPGHGWSLRSGKFSGGGSVRGARLSYDFCAASPCHESRAEGVR